MKKRILSALLAGVILLGSDGMVYAAGLTAEGEIEAVQTTQTESVAETEEIPEEEQEQKVDTEDAQDEITEDVAEEAAEEITEEEQNSDTEEEMEQEDVTDILQEESTPSQPLQNEEISESDEPADVEEPATDETAEESSMLPKEAAIYGSAKPAAPVLNLSNNSYDSVTISWKALELPTENSGYYIYSIENGKSTVIAELAATVAGYAVYEYKNGIKNETAVKNIAKKDVLDHTIAITVHNRQYQFQAAAYVDQDITNPESEQVGNLSNIITVTPKLKTPSVKAASLNHTSIKVSWGKVDEAGGYELYRSTSKSGKYSKITTITKGSTITYTDKKLSVGTTYYYKLRAYYTVNGQKIYSSDSTVKSAKVVPAAPTLNSVSSVNYNTLKIKWSKVTKADGYALYRSTSQNGKYEKVKEVKASQSLTYTDTKKTTGKKYYYKVRAYQTVGKSKVYGTYSQIRSGQAVPAKAADLKAKALNSNKIKLTWKKVSGAKSYTIYRSTSKNGTYKAVKTGCTNTTYTNSKLKGGTKYYYKVAAVRGKTTGKLTSAVSAKAVSLKTNKTSVTISKGGKEKIKAAVTPKATVKWSTANKKIAKVSSNGTITGVSIGNTKITAKANGVSTTVTVKVIPVTPKISSVSSVNYNTLKIQWKKISGADGYVVYRSTSKNGKYQKIATIKSAKTICYSDKKRSTGTKYYYKVRAYKTVKKSKVYSSYSAVKSGTAIPSKVTDLKVAVLDGNKIKLTWKKVSGAKSYTIYRSTSKNGTYKAVKTGCTNTTYTNSKLKNGTKYYYKVAAVRGKTTGKLTSAVSAKAATLSVSTSSINIQQGMKQQITATASPKATVKWSSSNTKVAKVSSNGTVTGVSAGSAKIYAKANGITKTITVKVKKQLNGIDVSKWQGEIDFKAVKNSGIDAVMIRVYNGYSEDPYFETNYKNAKAAGLNIGVYYYTYATTTDQAKKDAKTVLGILNGRSLQYPIAIDMEDQKLLNGLSNTDRTNILWSFCSTIQQNSKYKYALYANLNWLNNYFDNARLAGMPIWIARYCDPSLGHRYTGAGNVFMWQYSSQGNVAGINGYVDMNFVY